MKAHLLAIILWALAQAETPRGVPAHPGPAHETGTYQLTPSVRHDRSADLRRRGFQGPITDEMLAREQVLWIAAQLEKAGQRADPFAIGVAWNAGVTAKINGTAPDRSYDYGARISNLVEDRLAREPIP